MSSANTFRLTRLVFTGRAFLQALQSKLLTYVARVRFGIRVRVRVQDSAILKKVGAGAAGLGD